MAHVYGEEGLNEPAKAVEVLQIVVAARPTDAALLRGARRVRLQSEQHQRRRPRLRKGRQPRAGRGRTRVKNELAEVKANPSGEKTYTTTTNGKTYVGKLNAKSELEGTEVPSTSTSTTEEPRRPRASSRGTARLAPRRRGELVLARAWIESTPEPADSAGALTGR